MKFSVKNITILLFALVLISNLTQGFLRPQEAQAQLATFDSSNLAQQLIIIAKQAASYIQDATQWLQEKLGFSLRDIVAKKIMDYIVDQTVQWVAGGGSPKFVTNWNSFTKDIANIAFSQVINDVGLAKLCSPFGGLIKLSLLPVQRFPVQISCTLDQVVSNIKNFYNSFSNGGWLAYNSMWQPENNYYGQILMIQDQLQTETSKQVTAGLNEALSGKGFLGVKKCLQPIYQTQNESRQVCSQPDPESGGCLSWSTVTVPVQTQIGCAQEQINTPGDVVGNTVASAITSDSQWAANIQSWTSALVNAAINRLITSGLTAMLSSNNNNSSNNSYYPTDYQNLANDTLMQQKQQITPGLQGFLSEEQYLLNAKNRSLNAVQLQLVYLNQYQANNCGSMGNDISVASTTLLRLNSETTILRNSVNELNIAISNVNQAGTATDLAASQYALTLVYNKYNTTDFQQQISSGSARTAADTQATNMQANRDAAQNQLSQCLNIGTTNTNNNVSNGSD